MPAVVRHLSKRYSGQSRADDLKRYCRQRGYLVVPASHLGFSFSRRLAACRKGADDQVPLQARLDLGSIARQHNLRAVADGRYFADGNSLRRRVRVLGGFCPWTVPRASGNCTRAVPPAGILTGVAPRIFIANLSARGVPASTTFNSLAGNEMAVGERLHHVFRRHGRTDDLAVPRPLPGLPGSD